MGGLALVVSPLHGKGGIGQRWLRIEPGPLKASRHEMPQSPPGSAELIEQTCLEVFVVMKMNIICRALSYGRRSSVY